MTPVILVVLDGFGIAPSGPGNAIHLANPSHINSFFYSYPNTTLKASGQAVGLPPGEAGNTEVGHLNLGAGRIVYQDLPRINMSIADGSFYKNLAFLKAVEHIKQTGGALHLLGLVGGESSIHIHSSIEHLYALLFFAKEQKIQNVFIHAITDGRDSPPKSAGTIIKLLEEKLKEMEVGRIATVSGRYYAMDRDKRWERVEKAYNCLTKGVGARFKSTTEAIDASYKKDITDEFIEPAVIVDDSNTPVALVKEGDSVIFFNFRIDRPRELTKAFVLEDFENTANIVQSFDPYAVKYFKTHLPQQEIVNPVFKRGPKIENICFVTMTEYERGLPVEVAFAPITVKLPLARVLSEAGISQLHMAESEKERFIGFYFNGQKEMPFQLEERIIVPSPKVPTYDFKPEMSANELTSILIEKIREKKHSFILVNFANPDMVGHTGNIAATIKAIQAIDNCLSQIAAESLSAGYVLLITADHGNAEQKINLQTGEISTEHTSNPVPFIAIGKQFSGNAAKLQSGILADVAPTILALLGVQKPDSMTGKNLLEELKLS